MPNGPCSTSMGGPFPLFLLPYPFPHAGAVAGAVNIDGFRSHRRNSIVQDDIKLPCGKKDRFIHTLTGGAVGKPVLVCTAGYGAGAGFWWKNYSFMTDHFRVHSVDMLGCGLSGRPDFTAKTTREAEAFFVESLEEWRQVGRLLFLAPGS
mmetsp:Transcript_64834/g.204710  ORF Transcript_64834/g.204710 Transcript_64834/m.204710 type:complete len:150 (+) Transcript_64834:179-628(+)